MTAYRNYPEAELAAIAPQGIYVPVKLAMTGSSVRTPAALPKGVYQIISDTDPINWLQGDSGVTANSSCRYLPADTFDQHGFVVTGEADGYVAALAIGGNVYLQRIG